MMPGMAPGSGRAPRGIVFAIGETGLRDGD
jgi:hypothetical protein